MFTLDQIKSAHSKVKSGADFPAYIREIKQLGVSGYHTFVTDGHTEYFGVNDFWANSPAKYNSLAIVETSDRDRFAADLLAHQQGKTDYKTFCEQAARQGIEKWIVDMSSMTCTYYDKSGNEIISEDIPLG